MIEKLYGGKECGISSDWYMTPWKKNSGQRFCSGHDKMFVTVGKVVSVMLDHSMGEEITVNENRILFRYQAYKFCIHNFIMVK